MNKSKRHTLKKYNFWLLTSKAEKLSWAVAWNTKYFANLIPICNEMGFKPRCFRSRWALFSVNVHPIFHVLPLSIKPKVAKKGPLVSSGMNHFLSSVFRDLLALPRSHRTSRCRSASRIPLWIFNPKSFSVDLSSYLLFGQMSITFIYNPFVVFNSQLSWRRLTIKKAAETGEPPIAFTWQRLG